MESTPDGVCPGSCNTRWREATAAHKAAAAAYDPLDPAQSRPEPPPIQPVHGDPRWCAKDVSRIRSCLADLDTLAALLGWIADGHAESTSSDTGRVSGTAETRSPSDAADELADLMNILTEHENAYRETVLHIGTPGRRGYMASASSECIAWLGTHLDGILASEVGEAFGVDVLDWHRAWKRRAKAGVRKLVKPLRCPHCKHLLLEWEEGSDRVDCRNPDCNLVLTYAQYQALVEERAGRPYRQENDHNHAATS